ncbi:hypothetical protein JCM8547_002313 [Rhodosporidiobolus lusitaniae]
MCRSIAFLVYGIPVRTSSLIFAAEAWPRLEKTLPFFDLVSLRLSRGALKVEREEGVAAVSRVSVEVWETVEDELVKIKLEEAEAKFCSDVLGLPNEWGWDWLVDECESDRPYWDSFNGLYEVFISMTFWKGEHGRRLERLLRHFGLSLPPSGLLYLVENPADYVSPCAATFLATPRPSLPDFQTSSIEADCGGDWAPDGHALADDASGLFFSSSPAGV